MTLIPQVQPSYVHYKLRLERQRQEVAAGTVQAPLSIMYGTPAYFCARTHTHTHLLTHPHTQQLLFSLCSAGILATVARTASVHAPHLALLLQVCEGGEIGSGGVKCKDKCRSQAGKSGYSTRFMW